jgi:hypothetical protein
MRRRGHFPSSELLPNARGERGGRLFDGLIDDASPIESQEEVEVGEVRALRLLCALLNRAAVLVTESLCQGFSELLSLWGFGICLCGGFRLRNLILPDGGLNVSRQQDDKDNGTDRKNAALESYPRFTHARSLQSPQNVGDQLRDGLARRLRKQAA